MNCALELTWIWTALSQPAIWDQYHSVCGQSITSHRKDLSFAVQQICKTKHRKYDQQPFWHLLVIIAYKNKEIRFFLPLSTEHVIVLFFWIKCMAIYIIQKNIKERNLVTNFLPLFLFYLSHFISILYIAQGCIKIHEGFCHSL